MHTYKIYVRPEGGVVDSSALASWYRGVGVPSTGRLILSPRSEAQGIQAYDLVLRKVRRTISAYPGDVGVSVSAFRNNLDGSIDAWQGPYTDVRKPTYGATYGALHTSRQLPLVPTATRHFAGTRLNCGSPAVAYGGWWQNLLHPKRAQANKEQEKQATAAANEMEFLSAQGMLAQAEAASQSRFMWATVAGVVLVGLGGVGLLVRARRKNPRRRNRRSR